MENKWLKKISGRDEKIKLFCFPHAGAGGLVYAPWKKKINDDIGLYAVMLPGREKRMNEPLISDAVELCSELLEGIRDELDSPYILLGHSMGGIIVYEFLRQIIRAGLRLPEKIVVSATSLKGFNNIPDISVMNDDELADYLAELGGTNEDILAVDTFRECYFPIIRNDYKLVRSYSPTFIDVPVPIVAFAGTDDKTVNIDNMFFFGKLTNDFELHMIKGDHFYIEEPDVICPVLNRVLLGA